MLGDIRRVSDQLAQVATPTQPTANTTSAASGANRSGGFNPTVNVYGAGPDPQSMGREMIRQLMNYERLQGWR